MSDFELNLDHFTFVPRNYICYLCRDSTHDERAYSYEEICQHYVDAHGNSKEFLRGTRCVVCVNYFLELAGHPCLKARTQRSIDGVAGLAKTEVPVNVEVPLFTPGKLRKILRGIAVCSHLVSQAMSEAELEKIGKGIRGMAYLLMTYSGVTAGVGGLVAAGGLADASRAALSLVEELGTGEVFIEELKKKLPSAKEIAENVEKFSKMCLMDLIERDVAELEDEGVVLLPDLPLSFSDASIYVDALAGSLDDDDLPFSDALACSLDCYDLDLDSVMNALNDAEGATNGADRMEGANGEGLA